MRILKKGHEDGGRWEVGEGHDEGAQGGGGGSGVNWEERAGLGRCGNTSGSLWSDPNNGYFQEKVFCFDLQGAPRSNRVVLKPGR